MPSINSLVGCVLGTCHLVYVSNATKEAPVCLR